MTSACHKPYGPLRPTCAQAVGSDFETPLDSLFKAALGTWMKRPRSGLIPQRKSVRNSQSRLLSSVRANSFNNPKISLRGKARKSNNPWTKAVLLVPRSGLLKLQPRSLSFSVSLSFFLFFSFAQTHIRTHAHTLTHIHTHGAPEESAGAIGWLPSCASLDTLAAGSCTDCCANKVSSFFNS